MSQLRPSTEHTRGTGQPKGTGQPPSTDRIEALSREQLIELAQVTERWERKEDAKFFLYQPNPVPAIFHSSPAKIRAIFGGNRSSKTYSSIIDITSQFVGRAPASISSTFPKHRLDPTRRIRLCMNDYPNSFSKVIWPYIEQLVPSEFISDTVKDSGRIKAITNPYGGFIEFMQYDQEVSKFQGSSRHCIAYDEEPPQTIRDENLMRLVDTNGEEIFSMTPINEANYGASSRWVYDEIVLKASRQTEMLDGRLTARSNPEGDPDTEIFFANIYDNRVISKEAADRILSKYGKEEREVRTSGHFLFLSGLVYKEFSDDKHLVDDAVLYDSKGRFWPKSPDFTLYLGIDPHPRIPHAVIFLLVRSDGLLFVVDELFIETKTAKELVDAILVKQQGKTPNVITIDPSAFIKDPSTGSCLGFDLVDAGLYPVPLEGSKDMARGILKVRELLVGAERGPRIYIHRGCKRLRYELTHYVWDNWKKDTTNIKGEKQKPIDKDDHLLEALRRICLLEPDHVPIEDPEDTYDNAALRRRRN